MKILVTGGRGYIGAHLVRHLHAEGHQLTIGTRNDGLLPNWIPDAKVAAIHWHDVESLVSACAGCDLIIHAAGMNAQDCLADPVNALDFNGVATARLVQAATRAGVRRLVYLSTAHVYGSPLSGKISEMTCPVNLHPYSTSHLAGESAVLYAASRGTIETTVIRLSNACGAPVTPDANCWMLLFNDLCREAFLSNCITLRSDPRQFRDFIPITDAVRAIVWLAQLPSNKAQGVFNVGSGSSRTLHSIALSIAAGVLRVFGVEPKLNVTPDSGIAPESLEFSIAKLLSTGFKPVSSIETEVDAMLYYCKSLVPVV